MNAIDPAIHIAAANIKLQNVSKTYGKLNIIPKLDVEFRAGEFTVVLGPSGCGKSTLMQMIAGLERVSGGKIVIGDREVQDLEPKERGCAMVFQNYALYPHMTVFDNIAYSLKIAGFTKAERQARVEVVAKMLLGAHRLPGPQARSAFRWSTPACCNWSRHRARARRVAVRRTTF